MFTLARFCTIFATTAVALPSFFTLTPYGPTSVQCPSKPLLRAAQGLSADEAWYRDQRAGVAADALRKWLTGLNDNRSTNDYFPLDRIPIVAMASGGGSLRALLSGAGVVQAFDSRDPAPGFFWNGLKGLYQGLTYHTGVEAGSWLLAALSANLDTTVTSIVNDIWSTSFSTDDFLPANARGPTKYSTIALDLVAKSMAGYPPTLVDTWGRLLSQHLMYGDDGGVTQTLSGIVNSSEWQAYGLPYPILTALAINTEISNKQGCISANPSSPQYEFHPFEYGSWDSSIREFAQTAFMASPSVDHMPLSRTTCVKGFDNMGFLLAASSNEFNYWCSEIPRPNLLSGPLGKLKDSMIAMTDMVHGLSFLDEYAIVPASGSSQADSMPNDDLHLVSGGQAGEKVPLWPLIQPERGIGVIIANDNSQDTTDMWPNGTSLYSTYLRTRQAGLTTMPLIPNPEVFVERGYTERPTFFGCYDISKATIVYLPNKQYSFPSNIPDWIMEYSSEEVLMMLQNGNQVATFDGNEMYKTCFACILLWKVNEGEGLPMECEQCMDTFCYRP